MAKKTVPSSWDLTGSSEKQRRTILRFKRTLKKLNFSMDEITEINEYVRKIIKENNKAEKWEKIISYLDNEINVGIPKIMLEASNELLPIGLGLDIKAIRHLSGTTDLKKILVLEYINKSPREKKEISKLLKDGFESDTSMENILNFWIGIGLIFLEEGQYKWHAYQLRYQSEAEKNSYLVMSQELLNDVFDKENSELTSANPFYSLIGKLEQIKYIIEKNHLNHEVLKKFGCLCCNSDEISRFLDHLKAYRDLNENYDILKEKLLHIQNDLDSLLDEMIGDYISFLIPTKSGIPLTEGYTLQNAILGFVSKGKISIPLLEELSEKFIIDPPFNAFDTKIRETLPRECLIAYDDRKELSEKTVEELKKYLKDSFDILKTKNVPLKGIKIYEDKKEEIMLNIQESIERVNKKYGREISEIYHKINLILNELILWYKEIDFLRIKVKRGTPLKGKCDICKDGLEIVR